MKKTIHTIHYKDSRDLSCIEDKSIDLVVTSPPYPMIQMWDDLFCRLNPEINGALKREDGKTAFDLMHRELDKVWKELYRLTKDNRIICINIGDATRTVGGKFRLYSNHSRITEYCMSLGFEALPLILWRKSTTAPNKFMGSGMLPGGAYVTLEHEYILILRKQGKRTFDTKGEKAIRQQSAYFWEERNRWFSDIWEIAGKRQKLDNKELRDRSAAFPFELAYRLVNMYSVYGDTVLDPFLGTGTTTFAAMTCCRNSIGVEMDGNFGEHIAQQILSIKDEINNYTRKRIARHKEYIEAQDPEKHKYVNTNYNFPVKTMQEREILFFTIDSCQMADENVMTAHYSPWNNAETDESTHQPLLFTDDTISRFTD